MGQAAFAADLTIEQRRSHRRLDTDIPCRVSTDKRDVHARAVNLSEGGACLKLLGLGALSRGASIAVTIADLPAIGGVVRWTKDRVAGVQFTSPIEDHPQLKALVHDLEAEASPTPSARDEIVLAYERSEAEDE